MDPDSLRSILWHCNAEQLASIEDSTLEGSDRNLEWYTWHLWKRLVATELGMGSLEAEELQSEEPPDYSPPKGIEAAPGDYRALYQERKAELAERAAAAKERTAAAYQIAQAERESRTAKMIDKLAPAKRLRAPVRRLGGGSGGSRGGPPSASAALLASRPLGQVKLLKEIGLVPKRPAAPHAPIVTRTVSRPAGGVSSAATGHSSSLAGAALLQRTTGGVLGKIGAPPSAASRGGALHKEPELPKAAARAAAVAAAAAARATGSSGSAGSGASGSAGAMGFRSGSIGLGLRPTHSPASPASPASVASLAGAKRAAPGAAAAAAHAAKFARSSVPEPAPAPPPAPSRPSGPDPRVMYPRKPPPSASPGAGGAGKFAVPSARPAQRMGTVPVGGSPLTPAAGAGGGGAKQPGAGGKTGPGTFAEDDL
ncbi:hypothetical protein HYH03_009298 [Edaphochlamys debaryana]|uniref:Uncharacterized protein n=1 Tax=Edaphochlamys debaryana TaxID=47281 RepID=A0A835Y4H9_9CHLO|nr:hypothetical protein HYH03_009298 [Edaphochlamys debaryana]|eukprot:KAG2492350.1 hypothetical protein HYH03_009298 [Edaphochlamys debaryana]